MKKLLSVLLVFAVVFGLAACNPTQSGDMVLNWNIGADPQTIDPTLNGASDGGDVINQTFEGLVREVSGVILPGIAETWETSSDGLTVTFHLRDTKWSDGTDLTASDFVYSWKRGMDPATASEYAWIWEYTNIVGALDVVYEGGSLDDVGISAPDASTLVVELVNPTPYFVSLMAFYHFLPVKQSAVEAVGGEDGLWAKDPELVVCNGPFKLTSYTAGAGLTLVKNENYWDADHVYLSQINGYFIDIATTAFVKYNNGELDFIPDVPTVMIPSLVAESPEFYAFALLGTYYYNFNMQVEEFENAKLRRALTLAIDREAIVEALSGGQIPATGFVPVGFADNNGDDFATEAGDFGISTDDGGYAEAVTLFAEAASEMEMTVPELQAYLNGQVILYNTSEGHALVAQMVQESWNSVLGVQVTLQNQEWAVFQDTRQEGNYDIARGGWLTDFMDPAGLLAIFTQGNDYNDPKYASDAYDLLMTEAQETTDPAVHFAKLYAAQEILMADLPVLPVYYYSDIMMAKSYLVDWDRSVLGSVDFTHAKIEK
ncbi:MAG: peptide ABC transporter substrate-binding protein [Firmicutes bacterium]|nr:peptide ABC transporter substrate-binding protein [Bacillota bacterium]